MPKIAYICQTCSEEFYDWPSTNRKYCSMACRDPLTVEQRIELHTPERPTHGCWEWGGSKDSDGYGMIQIGLRARRVTRIVFELANGPIPQGMLVRHRCDNRACVRLDHLELGSPRANSRDMVERGRSQPGERNHNAKLNAGQVILIREAIASGERYSALARAYDVSEGLIRSIVRGRAWRHVGGPLTLEPRPMGGGAAKLTRTQVDEIRTRFDPSIRGMSAELAREYGVHTSTISAIICRRNWT